MPSDKNLPNDITIHQKYLEKIVKMQQDQEVARQQEYELLTTYLAQMNVLLDQLISVSGSGSTVAATKKYIPFQTGSQQVAQLLIKPANQDSYPTSVDVYKINDNRIIPHMTLINDGPGDIFFISAYAKDVFSTEEGHLNINDQRELFNVYEIRLRSTLPLTTFRLIEGIFRTGSFAPNTKANVEIRPTIQPNEILKNFTITCDNLVPSITITHPPAFAQTLTANYIVGTQFPPLPPGGTVALFDSTTSLPMPFTIPEGWILETFALFANSSTDFTSRNYFEIIPGEFTLTTTFASSARGAPINAIFNISEFNSVVVDPSGAPPGGRRILVTFTNDDPFSNAILEVDFFVVLRRMT